MNIQEQELDTATSIPTLTHPLSGSIKLAALGPLEGARDLLDALWRNAALHHQIGVIKGQSPYRNIQVPTAAHALELLDQEANFFFACAEYKSDASRKAENAAGAWGFWLDIDCSADKKASGKGYGDVGEASEAIDAFCAATGLLKPTHLVHSGGGLHCYWVLNTFIQSADWQEHAGKLKALTVQCRLAADPSRTADIASVMRLPSTRNHKYSPATAVSLVRASEPLSSAEFLEGVRAAHDRLCKVDVTQACTRTTEATHTVDPQRIRPSLVEVQNVLRTMDPDVGYDDWYRTLLVVFNETNGSQEGLELVTEWSKLGRKFKGTAEIERKWASFKPNHANPVTIGTLIHMKKNAETFRMRKVRDCESELMEQPAAHGLAGSVAESCPVDLVEPHAAAPARRTSVARVDDGSPKPASEIMRAVIEKVRDGDVMHALAKSSVDAMARIKAGDEAAYLRFRESLKLSNPKVPLGSLDRLVTISTASSRPSPTHAGYARSMVERLTIEGCAPVGHEGSLFVLNERTKVWVRWSSEQLEDAIVEAYDDQPNCRKRSDYVAIAQQAVSMGGRSDAFADAPVGLACPDGFYRIESGAVVKEPLSAKHFQRVQLAFSPQIMPTPQFDLFMTETFHAEGADEASQQEALLQEIAGATMLGIMCKYEKAVLFYDPFGRAGKGTTERILRQLVPPSFVTAVPPTDWDREYYLATLLGSRLNVAGELAYERSVPEKVFKSVLGRDLVTGRFPHGKPIKFRNEAGHLFMSNHLVSPSEQDEGFFARWLLVEFPNSRTRLAAPIDTNLAENIISSEMPGIAHWALEGARRLLQNGKFSASLAHDRLMEKWRRRGSSLIEFIHEECELNEKHSERRSDLYRAYRVWCGENGHKAYSKSRAKETLENNLPLGIKLASLNGHEIFRGVSLKSALSANSGGFSDF